MAKGDRTKIAWAIYSAKLETFERAYAAGKVGLLEFPMPPLGEVHAADQRKPLVRLVPKNPKN